MNSESTFIGLDLHAETIVCAAYIVDTGEIEEESFSNNLDGVEDLLSWIYGQPQSCKVVHEAGPTGYELAILLNECGVNCNIAATSKLQKPKVARHKKSDRDDAIHLTKALSLDCIPEVWIPDNRIIELRELSRAWYIAHRDVNTCSQQLKSYELKHKLSLEAQATNRKIGHALPNSPTSNYLWEHYSNLLREARVREDVIKKRIELELKNDEILPTVNALSQIRGISRQNAFALTVESGSFSRFDSAPKYASWLGLVPSNHSSGKSSHNGSITKDGSSYLRTGLINASCQYSRRDIGISSGKTHEGISPEVSTMIHDGEQLLYDKRNRFRERGMNKGKANTALAREISHLVWKVGLTCEKSKS